MQSLQEIQQIKYILCILLAAPLSGYLSDKYSMQTARWVVFVAGLTCALSVIASGWINSLDGIIVLFGFVPGKFQMKVCVTCDWATILEQLFMISMCGSHRGYVSSHWYPSPQFAHQVLQEEEVSCWWHWLQWQQHWWAGDATDYLAIHWGLWQKRHYAYHRRTLLACPGGGSCYVPCPF